MSTAAEILAGPGRIECSRLRANISTRQCAINQAQARVDPWGPLAPCRKCDQADRSREKLRPRRLVGTDGLPVKTRGYLEAEARGETAQSKNLRRHEEQSRVRSRWSLKKEIQELRDLSVRAGWSSRRIDRRLRELNQKASRAVKLALVRAWREELEELLSK